MPSRLTEASRTSDPGKKIEIENRQRDSAVGDAARVTSYARNFVRAPQATSTTMQRLILALALLAHIMDNKVDDNFVCTDIEIPEDIDCVCTSTPPVTPGGNTDCPPGCDEE